MTERDDKAHLKAQASARAWPVITVALARNLSPFAGQTLTGPYPVDVYRGAPGEERKVDTVLLHVGRRTIVERVIFAPGEWVSIDVAWVPMKNLDVFIGWEPVEDEERGRPGPQLPRQACS